MGWREPESCELRGGFRICHINMSSPPARRRHLREARLGPLERERHLPHRAELGEARLTPTRHVADHSTLPPPPSPVWKNVVDNELKLPPSPTTVVSPLPPPLPPNVRDAFIVVVVDDVPLAPSSSTAISSSPSLVVRSASNPTNKPSLSTSASNISLLLDSYAASTSTKNCLTWLYTSPVEARDARNDNGAVSGHYRDVIGSA